MRLPCVICVYAGYGGKRPFNYFVFGAAVSEVELDVLTGNVGTIYNTILAAAARSALGWGCGKAMARLLDSIMP